LLIQFVNYKHHKLQRLRAELAEQPEGPRASELKGEIVEREVKLKAVVAFALSAVTAMTKNHRSL